MCKSLSHGLHICKCSVVFLLCVTKVQHFFLHHFFSLLFSQYTKPVNYFPPFLNLLFF